MSYPNIHLLIVDTESSAKNIENMLVNELGFIGENIYFAGSDKQAFKILDANTMDLILTEWDVPGLTVLDFLKEVRGHSTYASLPFIIVSSEDKQQEILKDTEGLSTHFLTKSFSAKEFGSKLQQILKMERRVHERSKVLKDNKVTIILNNIPVAVGEIVNIGKGGLLAQLEVSRELIIYDQPTIHISYYGNLSKEVSKTLSGQLLRIERVAKDKSKKTAYYAFAFLKLDPAAKKFLSQLVS